MADLEAMLGALRAEGRRETVGGFTLDAAKAREKLREFQLADPSRYVLLLMQVMVLRGATQIDIEIDADDLRIYGHGAHPFTRDELADLYVLLFDEGPPRPGVREVALALNATMALDPRWVRLECAGPDGNGVRLEQRNGAADRIESFVGARHGIAVEVRERFKAAHFIRFLTRGGHGKEREHVVQRSVFAGLPITLDGKPVATQVPTADVGTWFRVVLGTRDVGILGLVNGGAGNLALVRHQVWISSDNSTLPDLVGVRGVLDVSHLRTDASVSEIVRDELWTEMIEAVRAARDTALAELARRHARHPTGISQLHGLLCQRMGHHREHGTLPSTSPYCDYLAVLLWRTLSDAEHTSATVLGWTRIAYTTSTTKPVPPGFEDVLIVQPAEVENLVALCGQGRAVDVTLDMHHAVTRENNRRAFSARKVVGDLPAGNSYRQTFRIDRAGFRGTLGYAPNTGVSSIRCVLDDCLLAMVPIPTGLSTIHAVIRGAFTPSALFNDVARNDHFGEAMHATLCAYAWAMWAECEAMQTVEEPPRNVVHTVFEYITGVMDGTWATGVLESVGFTKPAAAAIVERHGAPWKVPFVRGGPSTIDHPFARLPWFEDGAGTRITLQQILDAVGPTAQVPVVTFSRPYLKNPPSLVVRVDATRLALFEQLLGQTRIRKVGNDFESWLARERFAASPQAAGPAVDPESVVHQVRFDHDGLEGSVAVLASTGESTPWVVLVEGRAVAEVVAPAIRGLVGRVELAPKYLNRRCDGLVEDGKREAIEAVSSGLAALFDIDFEATMDCDRVAALVVDALLLACPTPVFARAWHVLVQRDPTNEAIATYGRVLRLAGEFDPGRVAQALQAALAQRSGFDLDDIVGDLASTRASKSPWADYRVAAAAALPRLYASICMPIGGGRRAPLSHVLSAFGGEQPVRYLPTGLEAPPELDDVVRLDPTSLMRLRNALGPTALVDDSPRVASASRRAAFKARPQLGFLELDPATTLATIVVAIDGLGGFLGVPRHPPEGHAGKIVVCCDRRPVAEIDPVEGTPWIGVLDSFDLGHDNDFEGLARREIEWIARVLDNHRPAMIDALCSAGFADADGPLRRQWVQHLVRCVMVRHEHSQPAFADAGIGEVVAAPLFVDAGGSVLALRDVRARFAAEQRVAFVRRVGLVPGIPALVVRDASEEALLRHLFEHVEDIETFANSRIAFMQRTATAPPLPTAPPDALAVEAIEARGLRGALWLPATFVETPTITLGPDDRGIDEWEGSAMFPCCGGIGGDGVEVSDDFSGCTLTRARADHLKTRATKLYVRLVRMLPESGLAADDPRLPWLRAVFTRLHEINTSGRSWPNHDMRALYRDLRDLPLLLLPNGRLVSWTSADRAALDLPLPGGAPSDIDDAPARAAPDASATPEPSTAQLTAATSASPGIASTQDSPPSEPPPPRPPPPPTPAQRLRAAVLDELRLLHRRATSVLAETCLETIRVEPGNGRRVATPESSTGAVIDSRHPVVMRAMADDADPLLVSLVASAALTALNAALAEIADTDEALLVRLHADHLTTAGQATS